VVASRGVSLVPLNLVRSTLFSGEVGRLEILIQLRLQLFNVCLLGDLARCESLIELSTSAFNFWTSAFLAMSNFLPADPGSTGGKTIEFVLSSYLMMSPVPALPSLNH